MAPITVLVLLLMVHFVLDFPLQGDTTALQKNPTTENSLAAAVPWTYWALAHACMHALGVFLVLSQVMSPDIAVLAAMIELLVHAVTDWCKCLKFFSIHVDQGIHVGTKIVFAAVLMLGRNG